MQIATCAALSMLLGPAVESITPTVDRWQSMDGMQRLSEAMIAYTKQHARYPARASFSAERQPLLTLHGHIHESTELTGQWSDQIGKTRMFNASHNGPELSLIRFRLDDLAGATRDLL